MQIMEVKWEYKQASNGHRPSGAEEDCIGRQDPQLTAVSEEEDKEEEEGEEEKVDKGG